MHLKEARWDQLHMCNSSFHLRNVMSVILFMYLQRSGCLIWSHLSCVSMLSLSGRHLRSEALQQRAHLPLHVPCRIPLQAQECAGGSEGLGRSSSGHAGVSSHCFYTHKMCCRLSLEWILGFYAGLWLPQRGWSQVKLRIGEGEYTVLCVNNEIMRVTLVCNSSMLVYKLMSPT